MHRLSVLLGSWRADRLPTGNHCLCIYFLSLYFLILIPSGSISIDTLSITGLMLNPSNIDFGIGIDYGSILATKVGVGGTDETKDLVWIGNAVNRATKISDKCKSNYNIGISKIVYDNILEYVKYTQRDTVFGINKENMWLSSNFLYNENWETFYTTEYHYTIN